MQKDYGPKVIIAMYDNITIICKDYRKKNYDSNKIYRFAIPEFVPLCVSDCIFDKMELAQSIDVHTALKPFLVHAMPFEDWTEVILGHFVNRLSLIGKCLLLYKSGSDDYDQKFINLLANTNNWCISPSYFVQTIEASSAFSVAIWERRFEQQNCQFSSF